jgi:hypothetical protein
MGGTHYLPASWGKSTHLNRWMSQLMIKPFSSVLLSGTHMVSTATVAGVVLLACPIPALAQNASINATQLSIDVAPITITGTRLGGSVSASGNGLAGGAPPTVEATGALTTGTTMTTTAGETFNYDVRARAGDAVAATATAGGVPVASFGSVSGRFSAGTGASLTIGADNAAAVVVGTGQGTTATAVFSTTMGSTENQAQVRRVATTSNQQATFTAERQATQFQFGGSGLTAVTAGGIVAGTVLGAAAVPVAGAGGAPVGGGGAFTLSQGVTVGEASSALTASTTDVTQPAYSGFTNTLGGTSAGTITSTNMNTVGVAAGGAGTSSSLSVIQSLTAF